jgi:hypothetical protein
MEMNSLHTVTRDTASTPKKGTDPDTECNRTSFGQTGRQPMYEP